LRWFVPNSSMPWRRRADARDRAGRGGAPRLRPLCLIASSHSAGLGRKPCQAGWECHRALGDVRGVEHQTCGPTSPRSSLADTRTIQSDGPPDVSGRWVALGGVSRAQASGMTVLTRESSRRASSIRACEDGEETCWRPHCTGHAPHHLQSSSSRSVWSSSGSPHDKVLAESGPASIQLRRQPCARFGSPDNCLTLSLVTGTGGGPCASRSKLQAFGSAASLYIHKILSDARSEGPRVQEPSQLELILNLRTANVPRR